jgi:hypothetical protein
MTRGSFLPATPALETDAVGDDADEDEDHPDEDDEMGEVLGHRECPDPWLARVRQVVLDEIEQEPEGDHDRTELREPGDGPAIGGHERGWRGRGIDRHGQRPPVYG